MTSVVRRIMKFQRHALVYVCVYVCVCVRGGGGGVINITTIIYNLTSIFHARMG